MEFLSGLPAAKIPHSSAVQGSFALVDTKKTSIEVKKESSIPPYGQRKGWFPRTEDDFEDGGAFPEIHIPQFPAGVGRKIAHQSVVPLQVSGEGKIAYDAVVKQGLKHYRQVFTRPEHALPLKGAKNNNKPDEDELAAVEAETRNALEATLAAKGPERIVKPKSTEFIRYTSGDPLTAGSIQRIVKMTEAQVDPLEPARFRHRRVPARPPSPPPPILRSPPRKLSAEEQQAWRVPPCISNWKNQRGYTIPLDKRLQADGRSLQEPIVNSKFAVLSEALYIAERCARDEIKMRNELIKQRRQLEEEQRERQLREMAAAARAERAQLIDAASVAPSAADTLRTTAVNPPSRSGSSDSSRSWDRPRRRHAAVKEEKLDDEAIARLRADRERKREIEREMRLERASRHKRRRDEDRDVSERVALGNVTRVSTLASSGRLDDEFDGRLYHNTGGVDSGFADEEKIFDKPLFKNSSHAL